MIPTIFDSGTACVRLPRRTRIIHYYTVLLTHDLPRTEHTFSIGSLVRFYLGPELNSTTYEDSTAVR